MILLLYILYFLQFLDNLTNWSTLKWLLADTEYTITVNWGTSVPNTHQLPMHEKRQGMAWERRLHSEPAVRVKHFMYTSTHRAPCLFSCIGSDATNITSSSVSGFQSSSTSSRTPLHWRASGSSASQISSRNSDTTMYTQSTSNAGNDKRYCCVQCLCTNWKCDWGKQVWSR